MPIVNELYGHEKIQCTCFGYTFIDIHSGF